MINTFRAMNKMAFEKMLAYSFIRQSHIRLSQTSGNMRDAKVLNVKDCMVKSFMFPTLQPLIVVISDC